VARGKGRERREGTGKWNEERKRWREETPSKFLVMALPRIASFWGESAPMVVKAFYGRKVNGPKEGRQKIGSDS